MNRYTELSDFDINLLVTKATNETYRCSASMGYVTVDGNIFNPCNNPTDAMPIINEYGISLVYQDRKFQFATNDGNIECGDSNPLKAAMIIFLCMKDAENES
ncbi:phage protein NinX family protein [Proteus faecis]|uniref:phage protein NinX family protein n=1 Tax=Proteus faecis TaxID=2050967 RepID=UPI001F1A1763|nr:phage protein NinX family protein [Proteus faecis]